MSELDPILDEIRDLHALKAAGYGREGEAFFNIIEGAKFAGIAPWVASLLRAGDKAGRLSLAAQGRPASDESVEDNLLDGINYWCIALALWRRTKAPDHGFTPIETPHSVPLPMISCGGPHEFDDWKPSNRDGQDVRKCQACEWSMWRWTPDADPLKTEPGDWQALEHGSPE